MSILTTRVQQSQIIDIIYYDKEINLLGVHFKTSDVTWVYEDVPAHVFGVLVSSASVGSFFIRHVRNEYAAHKIERSFYAEAKKAKKIKRQLQ